MGPENRRIGRSTAAGSGAPRSTGVVHSIGILGAELRRWPARRWWVALGSAAATYLFIATFVAYPEGAAPRRSESRLGMAGWMITFFEPVQPYLAVASIALLGWALYSRLTRENLCTLPARISTPEPATSAASEHAR